MGNSFKRWAERLLSIPAIPLVMGMFAAAMVLEVFFRKAGASMHKPAHPLIEDAGDALKAIFGFYVELWTK